MGRKMKLTYNDIYEKCKSVKIKPNSKIFGIPKGGLIPASIIANLNQSVLVDTPEESDYIIDDLIDSGKTKERYDKFNKKFIALYGKPKEWIIFPWELNETPAEDSIIRLLQAIGENPKREGLIDTPKRHLKYLHEFLNPPEFNLTTFAKENYDEMIIVKDIEFYSLCEHHLLPFFGKAAIAYIPNKNIVGLSKLPRVLEMFSRKLQNQERITNQVAEYLQENLNPKGVAVSLTARHLCMEMRGVRKQANTTTNKLIGVFKEDSKCREEFLKAL